MSRALSRLATLVACLALVTPHASAERGSLQTLLQKLRQNRDNLLGEMRGGVEAALHAIEEKAALHDGDGVEAARARLVALGPECAPLLVDLIDPGTTPTDPLRVRAATVVSALSDLKSRAITSRVLEMTRTGSLDGRVNAVKLLGALPDTERTIPALLEVWRGGFPELRGPALASLARVGGPDADHVISDALSDTRPEMVKDALDALASAHNVALAPKVLRIVATPADALRNLDAIVGYYRAVPEAADRATLLAFVKLASSESGPLKERLRVLELLAKFGDRFDTEVRKELRQLSDTTQSQVREGALVALVLSGDRNARHDLIAPYDNQIEQNRNYAQSYEQRADAYFRIADYKEALKDYQQSIKLSADDVRARSESAYVGLARCYALTNKLKEAAATLEKAPLSAKQIAELKTDPAFAKLVENPKYKSLFESK